MLSEYTYFHQQCPITGDTSGLGVCHLMEPTTHLVDLSDEEMARMEWAWGLERGGFDYYVGSPANSIFFRRDIADMLANEEFILLPTHKTYKDAMEFSRRIGFCDRAEDDYSPRRPLTALGRSFRYVFIPFSDAAQRIAEEIPMQQQTDEDWNGGVNPVTGEPMEPWVKEFRVVETHSHLVSVCYAARKVLDVSSRRPGLILCPWTLCLYKLEKQWGIGRFGASLKVPEWFINTPENDDESLSGTEATGYWPFLGSDTPSANRVTGYASSGGTNASQSSSRILEWARKVPQRKVPLRWSARLASKVTVPGFRTSGPVRRVTFFHTRLAMTSEYAYTPRKCAITGTTQGLGALRLIDLATNLAKASELQVARMEWAWGLERGGLYYYLDHPANDIFFRMDLGKLYERGDFILLPTLKTYADALTFAKRAGYRNRDEEDESPRRPLTALGRTFRYTVVPLRDCARELLAQIPLQSHTDQDWNGGEHPLTRRPLPAWTRDFPVIETHCHPVSICYFARRVLNAVTYDTGKVVEFGGYEDVLLGFEHAWGMNSPGAHVKPPQWFIDTPEKEDDDESLNDSEATGYWPLLGSSADSSDRVPGYAASCATGVSKRSSRVLEWAKGVPQRKMPPRIGKSTIPSFHATPARKVKSAESSEGSARMKEPGWMRQNGHFPTRHNSRATDPSHICFDEHLSSHNTMTSEYIYFRSKCAITGITQNLGVFRLIDMYTNLADVTDIEPANDIYFRMDLGTMYQRGEFILLPTLKTFADAKAFIQKAGYSNRDGEDDSPRRPMTALGKTFRYVVIPLVDHARELLAQVPLQSQTDEDWNGGMHPVTGKPVPSCHRDWRVVETHCHPVSVCYFARRVLDIVGYDWATIDMGPYQSGLLGFEHGWGMGLPGSHVEPPQWFVDSPEKEDDDESLSGSEATGYWPLIGSSANSSDHVPGYASSSGTSSSQSSSRILEWAKDLPQRKVLSSQKPRDRHTTESIIPSFHVTRARKVKAPQSAESSQGSARMAEPGWMRQNGHFPTRQFTSNDWALFCYGTRLSEDEESYTY
ncbi:hypothetical protein EV121DRAFT_200212 [Schizophyllum commune]